MSAVEQAAWCGAFVVLLLVSVVVFVRHERRALRSGTDVGIVHSMDIGGMTVSPGQGGISVDSLVQLKDNGCLSDTRGVVIHYDASPGYEAAIVRWANGVVTVETDVTRLVLDPFASSLAGVAR